MRLDKVGASADYEAVTRSHLFPFADWIGDLRDRKILRADIIAGITVFTVLIPQSMANAQLADLPPHFGLYAAFLPPIVAALFGSSRHLSTGSVALISLMSAAAIQPLAAPGSELHISLTILLALMVGLIQLGLGLARLGALVNLLSQFLPMEPSERQILLECEGSLERARALIALLGATADDPCDPSWR